MPWLPTNVQNRVISFALRRALGRIVKAGLDGDEVQAQLAQGAVDLHGLELDPEGLSQLLAGRSLPLSVKSGSVDHVTARFTGWSLAIMVNRLELDLTLGNTELDSDLTQSFSTHQDLVDTLAQSLADLELNAPGAFPTSSAATDEDESSILAGFVEQLMSRLTVEVNDVVVRIDHGAEYVLRVDSISHGRAFALKGISLRMKRAESEEDDEETVGYSDMLMSQAVGDLRQSSATVYASAYADADPEPPVLQLDTVLMDSGDVQVSPIVVCLEPWHLQALLHAGQTVYAGQGGRTAKDVGEAHDANERSVTLESLQVTFNYQEDDSLKLFIQGVSVSKDVVVNSVTLHDSKNSHPVLSFTSTPAISLGASYDFAPAVVQLELALLTRLLPHLAILDSLPTASAPATATQTDTPLPSHRPSPSVLSSKILCPTITLSVIPLHSATTILTLDDVSHDLESSSLSIGSASLECCTNFLTINNIAVNAVDQAVSLPSVKSTLDRPTIEALQFVADDVTHWLASVRRSDVTPHSKAEQKQLIKIKIDEIDLTLLVPRGESSWTVHLSARAQVELGTLIHLTIDDLKVEEEEPLLHGAVDLHFGSKAARETSIDLALIGLDLNITTDVSLASDLAKFLKAPEGAFADVVPSEITHVKVRLDDCSISTSLPSGALKLVIHSAFAKTDVTAGDNVLETNADLDVRIAEADVFVPLITAAFDARLDKGETSKLDVSNLHFRMAACADSLATLSTLVGQISATFPKSPLPPPPPPSAPIDVFASIDDEAFRATPHIGAGADMVDDDLPTHREYLDGSASADAIRILYDTVFELDDYWHALQPAEESSGGQLQVRIACEGEILLHDGYDWESTRQAIEDETQAVRRRLEKIRQLLAAGQTPDPEMERTSVLFNSIYIDPDDAWESLETDTPEAPVEAPRRTRSRRPLIEIAVRGAKVELDCFDEGEFSSRLHCTLQSLDIYDHIKTSTWKTFLTEKRGGVRETGADMVRLELLKVRLGAEEEARLKIKIMPLRLHVDQDALDFLKRFFGFRQGGEGSPVFFQHVEVYPVELKLDYKPKRVDLTALREGRTIELMNFFHFDGAEMTLRHVTLSGIKSTDLATTLNDLWTPDVKAHQLADVISGVSPIRSMVNVGSGVADLILLPLEQYRKDGRVARGMQRGTTSFMRTTAMEGLKLGARLATGTQVVLEHAEMVLGGRAVELDADAISRYAHQPQDAREGLQAAYRSLAGNVNSAAQTILAVPMEVYDENSSVKAVVRAVPIAVLKPMIGASEAVSKTLLGLRNGMSAEARLEQEEKYKR